MQAYLPQGDLIFIPANEHLQSLQLELQEVRGEILKSEESSSGLVASEWFGGAYEQLLSKYEQLLLQNSMLKQQLTVCAEEQ